MFCSSAIELNFDLKISVGFNLKIWFCYTPESPDCTLLKELIPLLTLTTIVGQSLDNAKMECLTSNSVTSKKSLNILKALLHPEINGSWLIISYQKDNEHLCWWVLLTWNRRDVFVIRSVMFPVVKGCLIQAHISHRFGHWSVWDKLNATPQLPQLFSLDFMSLLQDYSTMKSAEIIRESKELSGDFVGLCVESRSCS